MGTVIFSDAYTQDRIGLGTYDLKIVFSENYSISTNKTTVRITNVFLRKNSNSANYGSMPVFGAIEVNGTTLISLDGSPYYANMDGTDYREINIPNSGSVDITHNDDGTGAASFQVVSGDTRNGVTAFGAFWTRAVFGITGDPTQSVPLTTRPRASTISSCPTTAETNHSITLKVNRNSSSFYHKASFIDGGTTKISNAFATSLEYTIPKSWFASHTDTTTFPVTVSVQTYTDSTCTVPVGSPATTTMTVIADASITPSVSSGWATVSAYNTGTAAENITGYVKGFSKAAVAFDDSKVTNKQSATTESFSVTCQGVTVSVVPYRTPTLTSTSVVVTCTVTDSRGRSASQDFSITVMDYAKPKLSGISVYRCDASQAAAESGTYISVKATGSCSSLGGQNTCTLTAAVAASGGTYGSATSLTSGQRTRLGPVSADTSYTVRIRATDSLGKTATYYAAIPTQKWAMKFRANGTGVAFGKAAETDNVFEVSPDWEVRLGQPLPIASGGTGATTAEGALTNLGAQNAEDIDGTIFYKQNIGAGDSLTFTFASGVGIAGTVLSGGANASRRGIMSYGASASGNALCSKLFDATDITITTSGRSVTLQNTGAATIYLLFIHYQGGRLTFS